MTSGKSFAYRIYFVALILRLIPVILARGLGIGLDDMFQYDMLARSLASGHGYRWYAQPDLKMLEPYVKFDLSSADYDPELGISTSFRPPLYPVFLALVYLFSGMGTGRFFVARLVQAGLVSLLAPLTYLTAQMIYGRTRARDDLRSLGKSNDVPEISAWIVALYPMLVAFPLALATENLFAVLMLAAFLLLLVSLDKPTTATFILTGILLGLSVLTRSVVLVFCGLVLLWFWYTQTEHRRKIVLMFLSMSLVIMPWVIRNSLLHHRLAGIETALGYQLYLGYHPESDGTFKYGISLDLIPILDDGARDRIGTEKSIEFIRQDPSRFIPLMFNRLGYFFGLERRGLQYFYSNDIFGFIPLPLLLFISAIILLPFVLISIFGVFGLVSTRRSPPLELLILLGVGYTLPHLFIISEERFHLTLVPVIAILAANFLSNGLFPLLVRWQESRMGKKIVIFAILMVILLITNWGFELEHDWDKIAQLFGPNGNQTYFPY